MLRKLLVNSTSSTFGLQSVIKRTKTNQWGTYGYSNFGHHKPDHFPPITKVFHLILGVSLIGGFLDWEWVLPKIMNKYYSTIKKMGFKIPEEVENPPPPSNKFAEYRMRHRDRTMPAVAKEPESRD